MSCQASRTKMKQMIAKEDIVCFKVVDYNKKTKQMFSFDEHCYTEFKFDKCHICDERFYQKIETWHGYNEYVMYYGGYLSYRDFGSALQNKYGNKKVLKCIIPQGSKYYEGTLQTSYWPTYYSKELIVKDIVCD